MPPVKTIVEDVTNIFGDTTKNFIFLEENMSYEGVKKIGEPAGWYEIGKK